MYIRNAIYKPVKIKQSLLPLAEGTVLNLAGNLASDDGSDAYGIVSQRVETLPPSGTINIAVSGTIDLTENNVTISDNLIHGLHEFNFLPFQEVVIPDDPIPVPSAGDAGKVPTVQNDLTVAWETPGSPVFVIVVAYDSVEEAWTVDKTTAQVLAAYNAGSIIYLKDTSTGPYGAFPGPGTIPACVTLPASNPGDVTVTGIRSFGYDIATVSTILECYEVAFTSSGTYVSVHEAAIEHND